jgi:hypothetical protein
MASLAEHNVYLVKGRVFVEDDGSPTPDVIAVGAQQLTDSSSNPLTEYNTTFTRLQSRLRLRPLVGGWPESDGSAHADASDVPPASAPPPDVPPTVNAPLQEIPPADLDDLASEGSDDPEELEQSSAFEQTMEEDDEPTLTRNTAADVALDMDGGNASFLFADEDEDDFYIDDGAIDNSDDDYVED